MTDIEQKKAAKEFAERWKDKGYEKGESQKYWIDLLSNVLGVSNATEFITFEDTVHIDKATGFIDGFINKTKVLIEQKSINKDLRKAIVQSDGSLLNPFQQAKRYSAELPYDDRPRWIITCNFKSMLVYDMNNPNGEPEEILLKYLSKEYYRLSFIVDSKNEHLKKEEELSFKAGELVGKLYDAFSKEYKDIENEQSQKDLNELCVRLVFCLYAEDAGLFGRRNVFHDYLAKYENLDLMRKALIELFKILDTPLDKRDPYLEDDLNQFPYVNGGLFSNENIEIPKFTEEIRNTLLSKASDEFYWSQISPTIFGAVFESTLNPETRRAGGMHYTSIENIHKVIDPLFLNDLREKLNEAESYKNEKTRNEKLNEFQNYIASLKFFDPACGSGNFLTESYLALRRLENEAIQVQQGTGVISISTNDQIKVSIQQFYGIEINDFAVKVAKTALWIAEAQMYEETQNIVFNGKSLTDFLPLETYNNIVEGNALRIDWNEVLLNTECNYIMGNPPFVGSKYSDQSQKEDMDFVFENDKNIKYRTLDYVSCWYLLASKYIKNTIIRCAFVSTNSICQGEQTEILWKILYKNNIRIIFGYKTFRWDSEASLKAHVHCIIVGFDSLNTNIDKYLYENGRVVKAANINAYLVDANNIFIESKNRPLDSRLKMIAPNKPCDYNNLKIEKEDYENFIEKCPQSKKWIKKMVGAQEFINNKLRYCLWLVGCEPSELRGMPLVLERVDKCKEDRIKANTPESLRLSETPTLFREQINPEHYLIIPCVSSARRKYIPIGFLDKDTIPVMGTLIIPNADLFYFGLLTSNVHMAWMRAVAGRLKSDYRYSKDIVYNNFPWPTPNEKQKEKIERAAQMILDARAKYPNSSLADLYDELTMPVELKKAHQENDKAVMEAYGFDWRKMTESDCVAKLMEMYQELVNKNQ
ncbi:MAG: class I SAM-dependent DNA methyltransferase [Clostridiaceae bacterium]|nr:class I SAM-dependent DNA methyltransferase [Clostridiaceae bacterium]